jgi:hypothetical protein
MHEPPLKAPPRVPPQLVHLQPDRFFGNRSIIGSTLEVVSKPPFLPDLGVRLEAQSSKYSHIFLRLRFFAFLDLEPD